MTPSMKFLKHILIEFWGVKEPKIVAHSDFTSSYVAFCESIF